MTLTTGDIIAGRFRIGSLAGTGGMGSVFRARDEVADADVAVKVLSRPRDSDLQRFLREGQVLRELRHPNIVAYVDHGALPDGGPYLSMEWVDGKTLADLLQGGALGLHKSLHVALGVARALAVAHGRGVVHRDIKPRNIMIADDGTVKVLDFGIARAEREAQSLTLTGVFIGTPGYIAPEQARGEDFIDGRADIFSLGCVLFEMLTGRPAFVAWDVMALLAKLVVEEVQAPSELVAEIPTVVDDLVSSMLAKDLDDRVDAGALVVALEGIIASLDEDGAGSSTWSELSARRMTEGELRLLSVVLAGGQAREDRTLTSAAGAALPMAVSLHEALGPLGIRPQRLADGSVVCVISASEVATDLVAKAARCALIVRQALELESVHGERRPVVIATGRGVLSGQVPAGEVIERAVAMLRRMGAASAEAISRGWVGIDQLTAGLLDASFDVRGRGHDLFLASERGPLDVRKELLGREAPFIGRDKELAYLESLFEECREGPGAAAVAILGHPGMGKSRLLGELLRRIEAGRDERHERRPVSVLVAKGDAIAAQSPLSLVAQLVRRAADIHDDEAVETRRLKLMARVMRHVDMRDADRVAVFLGELASARFPADERPGLAAARHDPMLMREELERAWCDFLAAELGQPLVLVIEDLQWGDLPSVKYLELALRVHRDRPLFVVIAGRHGTETQFASFWESANVHELKLAKLSRAAGRAMVRAVLGDALPESRVAAVLERADGNPFFLEELIRAIAESSTETLPETLIAMVNERLDALDPAARRVLRAASVFGETFWVGGLESLLGHSAGRTALSQWLELLSRAELLVRVRRSRFQDQDEWAFRHALLREAAYASLIPADKVMAHRAAAAWLEHVGESDAALLAEHFERGAEPQRAAMFYRVAAEAALEGNDLEGAIARAIKGRECGATREELARLRIVEGEVHALRGQNTEAERCGSDVLSLMSPGSAPWCWAAGTTAALRVMLGEVDGARELADALANTAPHDGGAAVVHLRACAQAAPYILYTGQYDVARRLMSSAERAVRIDSTAAAAIGWRDLTCTEVIAWTEGDNFRALLAARAAQQSFRAARSELAAAIAGIAVGKALARLGLNRLAASELADCIAIADRLGASFYGALARMHAGRVAAARGEPEHGRALLAAAAETFYRQGNTTCFGIARMLLAGVLIELGDLDGAEREASEAELFALFCTPALSAICQGVLGRIHHLRGRLDEALAAFTAGALLIEKLGAVADGDVRLSLGHAETLDALGREAEASAIRAEVERRVRARAEAIEEPEIRAAYLEESGLVQAG